MNDSFKDKKKNRIWRLVLFVILIILDNLDASYLHTLGTVGAFIGLLQSFAIVYLGFKLIFQQGDSNN